MRVILRENHTAVLVILAVILRVIYLLLTSKLETDPAEVYCVWPRVPELLY